MTSLVPCKWIHAKLTTPVVLLSHATILILISVAGALAIESLVKTGSLDGVALK